MTGRPEIEMLTDQVTVLMGGIGIELQESKFDQSELIKDKVVFIAFLLGWEYFTSARDTLKREHVVGGNNLIRASIENLADLFYIFKDENRINKYAEAYVVSQDTFKDAMFALHTKGVDDLFMSRGAKQVNKWAGNASIDDRLKDLSPVLLSVYDFFSYFSHPNPASIAYMRIEGLKKGQTELSKAVNSQIATVLMIMCIKNTNIKSVSLEEIEEINKKLDATFNFDK